MTISHSVLHHEQSFMSVRTTELSVSILDFCLQSMSFLSGAAQPGQVAKVPWGLGQGPSPAALSLCEEQSWARGGDGAHQEPPTYQCMQKFSPGFFKTTLGDNIYYPESRNAFERKKKWSRKKDTLSISECLAHCPELMSLQQHDDSGSETGGEEAFPLNSALAEQECPKALLGARSRDIWQSLYRVIYKWKRGSLWQRACCKGRNRWRCCCQYYGRGVIHLAVIQIHCCCFHLLRRFSVFPIRTESLWIEMCCLIM